MPRIKSFFFIVVLLDKSQVKKQSFSKCGNYQGQRIHWFEDCTNADMHQTHIVLCLSLSCFCCSGQSWFNMKPKFQAAIINEAIYKGQAANCELLKGWNTHIRCNIKTLAADLLNPVGGGVWPQWTGFIVYPISQMLNQSEVWKFEGQVNNSNSLSCFSWKRTLRLEILLSSGGYLFCSPV